jgi:hypothetical protein
MEYLIKLSQIRFEDTKGVMTLIVKGYNLSDTTQTSLKKHNIDLKELNLVSIWIDKFLKSYIIAICKKEHFIRLSCKLELSKWISLVAKHLLFL